MPQPAPHLRLGLLLRQSHQKAAERLNDALSPFGLTGRHFGVLLLLDRDGVSTQRDLLRLTGSDKAGMVRTVADLESLGYIVRTPSAHDKRLSEIVLSPAGNTAFESARRAAGEAGRALFGSFSDDELDTLEVLLARFLADPDTAAD